MAPAAAFELWQRYNQKLVDLRRQNPFPIIEYCLENVSAYCEAIAGVAISLGLSANLYAVRKFVESKLEHHTAVDEPVPAQCQELYTCLQEYSYQPDLQSIQISRRGEVKWNE